MAIKEYFFEGKTLEAALDNAAAQLNEDKDMMTYELVQTASKGLFGIGATPAKIKIEKEVPDEKPAAPVKTAPVKTAPVKTAQEKSATPSKPAEPKAKRQDNFIPEKITKKEPYNPVTAAPTRINDDTIVTERKLSPVPDGDENVPVITEFILGLLHNLEIENGAVKVSLDDAENYFVQVEGSKMGVLIGRRGETLDAAQYLTNIVVNRGKDTKIRVILDSENYRAKRIATLASLANKTADKAIKYKRNQSLEPMDSYERRIIHASLSGRENITTYSVGTDPRRKVIVAYKQ